ncbi:MAG: AAC(3) family N-acetyltransferase [bacterium]|nr:AAC(3) family N-acetyltransferase [bacterium]
MDTPATQKEIASDLRTLGIAPGDTLFIHSSFKSLGPVQGGAPTVISALEDAIGPDGLLSMPSFNLVEAHRRAETWNLNTTPSTVGWLTEYFRCMPDTFRSNHYSHAVAARGKNAQELVSGHPISHGLKSPWDQEPWGRTYGTHSPMYCLYEQNAKLLMLGVTYESSTFIHLVEVLYWNRRLETNPEARYTWLRRPELGQFWDQNGTLARGQIARATCRLFHIQAYVDTLYHEVEQNPAPYSK